MEEQQQLTKEQFERIRKLVSTYQYVFSTPEGKAVLEDLERTHHVHSSTFHPQSEKAIYFAEGERNVVLRIKSLLTRDLKQMEERMKHVAKPTLVTE